MRHRQFRLACRDFEREFLPLTSTESDADLLRSVREFGLRLPPRRALEFRARGHAVPLECLPNEDLASAFEAHCAAGVANEALIARLYERSPEELYALWKSVIRAGAAGAREQFSKNLAATAWVVKTLGGDDALYDTFRHVDNTLRWWL